MARIVILGGGFGGAAAALAAQTLISNHEIVLIDRDTESYLCGVNPAVIVGAADPVSRSIESLTDRGIRYVNAEIDAIDLEGGTVFTSGGQERWDYLIIALGVSYDWDAVPGSSEAFSFYDRASSLRLRERLADFEGGSIVIGIGGMPYRCPPAPLEAALMIHGFLTERGVRSDSSIVVAIPEPAPVGVAGPAAGAKIRDLLEGAGIELLTDKRAQSVGSHSIEFADGTSLDADIPIIVPVHRLPSVLAATDIADGNPFVPVDRGTLESRVSNVFVVGDSNGIPVGEKAAIPKAGVFATGQGRHVATVIASRLGQADDPVPYDGVGHCFLMLGTESGAQIGGAFLAEGGPDVSLDGPSPDGRRAKTEWEEAWARFEV